MNYKKTLEFYKELNLVDAGALIPVDLDLLDEEAKAELRDAGYDLYENNCLLDVWAQDYAKMSDAIYMASVQESAIVDEDEREYIFSQLIRSAEHYLVFAANCRWDGSSGYLFANNMDEVVRRDYDCVIQPSWVSRGGKLLCCRESSHDVPQGGNTYVIALTDREYQRLLDASFETVETFVKKTFAYL